MKIRIVCYEDVHKWIIGKFALRLEEHLARLGHHVTIGDKVDESSDINHHIIYSGFDTKSHGAGHTLMITHIDSSVKINLLKKQLLIADMGICMSRQTLEYLTNLGVPRNKLCYVNPAHDEIIKPRKSVIGITCRVQEDGRKREYLLGKLATKIDPDLFSFKIMGDGWDKQVEILRSHSFHVDYTDHFDYGKYNELIPGLDFYLYMGQDEGQMGFVDAVAAGVPTIVTEQGYHLDAKGGVAYGFNSFEELIKQFEKIENEKRNYRNSVKSWNWEEYTLKHLDVWKHLLDEKQGIKPLFRTGSYSDGLYSLSFFDNAPLKLNKIKAIADSLKLTYGRLKQAYFFRLNRYRKNKKI